MERVRDWMTPEVVATTPTTSAHDALALMRSHQVRHVLVKSGDQLVGIVSNRDAVRAALAHPDRVLDLVRARVADIMTPSPLLAVGPESRLADASRLMVEYQVSALPVLEDGRVVGVITTSDFLRAFFQGIEAPI